MDTLKIKLINRLIDEVINYYEVDKEKINNRENLVKKLYILMNIFEQGLWTKTFIKHYFYI